MYLQSYIWYWWWHVDVKICEMSIHTRSINMQCVNYKLLKIYTMSVSWLIYTGTSFLAFYKCIKVLQSSSLANYVEIKRTRTEHSMFWNAKWKDDKRMLKWKKMWKYLVNFINLASKDCQILILGRRNHKQSDGILYARNFFSTRQN